MESKRRNTTTVLALTSLLAGLALLLMSGAIVYTAAALILGATVALSLSTIKKWLTDTTCERERLRHAILTADESTRLAQVGRAIQMAERERERRIAEHARQEAERLIRAARREVEQNEINTAMRAHAFEEACERRYAEALAKGIAAERQRADEEIAAVQLKASNERSQLMIGQFMGGVYAERSGEVDAILAAMEDPKLIRLDDHRRQDPTTRAADGR